MAIERILGTDTGKAAFEKADRNFVAHEVQISNFESKKMPISTNTVGAVGEFKKIQGDNGASLSLPVGGTWEYQAYWLQTSTGYSAFIGGGGGGIAAGGTLLLNALTGYTPIAFIRRIA